METTLDKSIFTGRLDIRLLDYYLEKGELEQTAYDEIHKLETKKVIYLVWLAKMVMAKNLLVEDIYKFDEYLEIFNKHKQKYDIKDVSQIKERYEFMKFVEKTIEIREKQFEFTSQMGEGFDPNNYVSMSEIETLEKNGIEFVGMCDGYQIFEVKKECVGNENAFNAYKNILGRCANRDKGAKIDLCTMANMSYFNDYLKKDEMYVIFNLGDPKSPYQFSYATNQFMDKNDNKVF